MTEPVQYYRATFKCSIHGVFRKRTANPNLQNAACPDCKKAERKQSKITKFTRYDDGPIPSTETKADPSDTARVFPNTIYKCRDCFAVAKVFEQHGETILTECPACGGKNLQYRGTISHEISSDSVMRNKAVDTTANIVMEDYKLTDLKDNVRAGETMAPKLAPVLQEKADNMFGGARRKNAGFNGAALARLAKSGALRDPRTYVDPVATLKPQYKPKVNIVAEDKK